MAIIFIGTPAFAVPSLQRLVADGYAVSAVITQPDRPAGRGRQPKPSAVKIAAESLGLTVLQPESLRDSAALNQVRALAPECAVAVAYGQILRREFLDIPLRGVVNIHPSLLPKYRGASPIPAAILAGEDVTGVTIMLMDAGMDSGPILAQRVHPIDPEDTTGTLSDKLAVFGAGLLAETLPRWLSGDITPQPQDATLATTTSLLRKEDGAIDWSRTAMEIWRQVRACSPWPSAFTHLDGEPLHIWRAWPLDAPPTGEPGAVVALSPARRSVVPDAPPIAVQTGDGLLAVREAQRPGRRTLPAAEFLRGMPNLIGRRLR
jgi:methionyl-tRNA formyltransferase